MELDFEIITIAVTAGMWAFILFLVWGIKAGFTGMREKIILSVISLPLIYFIIIWQKNR